MLYSHCTGSVGLVEHAMWLRLACYNWFDCLGLIEHTRWLRLACYAGLVASVWLNMQGGGDLHAVLVWSPRFGWTCKVAETCMLYWFGSLGLVEHARWLRLACYTGFCIGFVTGVCNPVGFRVVCFVQGTEIPLVHVVSDCSWFLGWSPCLGFGCKGMYPYWF